MPKVNWVPDWLPNFEIHLYFLRSRIAEEATLGSLVRETEIGRERGRPRTLKEFIDYTFLLPVSSLIAYLRINGAHGV